MASFAAVDVGRDQRPHPARLGSATPFDCVRDEAVEILQALVPEIVAEGSGRPFRRVDLLSEVTGEPLAEGEPLSDCLRRYRRGIEVIVRFEVDEQLPGLRDPVDVVVGLLPVAAVVVVDGCTSIMCRSAIGFRAAAAATVTAARRRLAMQRCR